MAWCVGGALGLGCSSNTAAHKDGSGLGADADAGIDVSGGDASDAAADTAAGVAAERQAILSIAEDERFDVAGLQQPVHIVETAAGVPHIYASSALDLAFAHGFVVGRDRWFVVDMGRRLGAGKVAALLGDAALSSDIESRQSGLSHVAAQILAVLTPAQQAQLDAFAAGLNAARAAVLAGSLPPPSELVLAAPLLGAAKPTDLMEPFTRADIAAFSAVIIYQLGYETGDVGRGLTERTLPTLFEGKAHGSLRRKAALEDIWLRLAPVAKIASAQGFGLERGAPPPPPPAVPGDGEGAHPAGASLPPVERSMLTTLTARLDALAARLGRVPDEGWGSNAWAVAASVTSDGRALLAGDGHLPLTIPSLFYQIGLDDVTFGGGTTRQAGLVIPGLPLLAVGTNGDVAWCQTQLMGDITDWYAEQLVLASDGMPKATRFHGKDEPVVAIDDTVVSAALKSPLFPSKGGTFPFRRFQTFDGRWISSIEGKKLGSIEKYDPAKANPKVAAVLVGDDWVQPGDVDGDGVVSAISFDYTGLDRGNVLLAVDGFGHAKDVHAFRAATRKLVAYSQNLVAADRSGQVLYTGYQAVPCRKHLPRGADGRWLPGADPNGLLDGTQFGAFTIAIQANGDVDEQAGADDASRCVVPFETVPAALQPARGYVLTANNDPGGASFDDRLDNDVAYLGGPWDVGFRAARIDQTLAALAKDKAANMDAMAALQADVSSPLGCRFGAWAVGRLQHAAALAAKAAAGAPGALTLAEQRVVAAWLALGADGPEVASRVQAWIDRGCHARAGVETFYHPALLPQEADDAVATTIWNRWWNHLKARAFDDEPMPGIWRFSGSTAQARTLERMTAGVGLAAVASETGASILWDQLATPEVEGPDEIAVLALGDALAWLRGAPKGPGAGGFGDAPMAAWRWGLRHQVKFESTIADFFSSDGLSAITDLFSIQTDKLPLLTGDPEAPGALPKGDPRLGLLWFPRPGDAHAVDAAGGSWGGDSAHYGSGPVFRMVIALGKAGPEIRNVLPGGQSGLNDSKHFSDQAALWLANKTLPMPFGPAAVAGAAVRRVVLAPLPAP